MPNVRNITVVIRQDGAKPHTGRGNLDFFRERGQRDGFNITVVTQPAQSPDMNINDLGFFRSLKCRVAHAWLVDEQRCLDVMMEKIEELWQEYDYDTLERIWAHQLDCYREILRLEGGNNYPNPHGGSIVRQRAGRIVANMFVERALVDHCQEVCENYF